MSRGKPQTAEEFLNARDASLQQNGFDNQFACYVYFLFDTDLNDIITYEGEDDIAITKADDIKWLIQVKYTVDITHTMSNLDSDFWKTIETWIDYYNILSSDLKNNFFKAHKFFIYTRKKINNDFYDKIKALHDGDLDISGVREFIAKETKINNSRQTILEKLYNLSASKLCQFLMKVYVKDDFDPKIEMYNKFLSKYGCLTKSDEIVYKIVGRLLKEKTAAADAKTHLSYKKQFFLDNYKEYWDIENDIPFTMIDYDDLIEIPIDYREFMFVKQLESIAVITPGDRNDDRLSGFMSDFFGYSHSVSYYESIQLLTPTKEQEIERIAIKAWKFSFDRHSYSFYRANGDENSLMQAGANCFYDITGKGIPYINKTIEESLSRGWYLKLSNESDPRVVWRFDWKNKLAK